MATPTTKPEGWSRIAHLYAKAVNENDPDSATSRSVDQINSVINETLPLSEATYILDMGSGHGPVIASILDSPHAASIPPTARIVAADSSPEFLALLRERKQQALDAGKTLWERLEIQHWDARDLSQVVRDGAVSHLVAGFAYYAMTRERDALAEARRVLAPGGLFVETSMAHTDWGRLPAFITQVRPDKPVAAVAEHWVEAERSGEFLAEMGFREARAREFEVFLPVASCEEGVEFVVEVFPFVKPLLSSMEAEEAQRAKALMLEYLRGRYPNEGPVKLRGTAVVGWGRK